MGVTILYTLMHLSFFIFLYPWLLYSLVLLVLARIVGRRRIAMDLSQSPNDSCLRVTFIVVFHNEQDFIERKLANTLSLEYPQNSIEYIFVSDGSTDGSDSIVLKFKEIELVRSDCQLGKERCIDLALRKATGDIVVFSDVGALMQPCAVAHFVDSFGDRSVGAVSSVDFLREKSRSLEGVFVRFEMFIRAEESKLSSSVGVSGSAFATRVELARELIGSECSDLSIAFVCVRQGYRVCVNEKIPVIYSKSRRISSELRRKNRTIVHGIRTVFRSRDCLNPFLYGWFSWQLLSHKLLRWLSPPAFLIFISLAVYIYILPVVGEIKGGYLTAILALLAIVFAVIFSRFKFLAESVLFILVCLLAVFNALWDLIIGNDHKVWTPTRRNAEHQSDVEELDN